MISDPWLAFVLAALFVGSSGYCLWRLTRPDAGLGRIGHSFHLIMCLSMLAMVWAVPTAPYPAQVVVFAVAALWFAGLAVTRDSSCDRAAPWYHAAMMGAMVWMAVAMAGWTASGSAHASSGSGDMTGTDMAMPGMHHGHSGGTGNSGGTASHAPQPEWTTALDVAIGVLFLSAALWWLRRYFLLRKIPQGRSPASEWGLLCEVAMALGMGVMTLAMV